MQKHPIFTNPTQALNAIGLNYDALQSINASDVLQRVPTIEHPRTKNGWIIQFSDKSFLAGNWETGTTALYSAKGTEKHTKRELKLLYQLAELNQLKATRERELQYSQKATLALNFWLDCDPVIKNPIHPYLERKRIYPVTTIRETTLKELRKSLDNFPTMSNERILVIPLVFQGLLASLQFITESGQKFFLKGGRTGGCYWQSSRENNPKSIAIAEGVATVLSVIQHIKEPTLGVSAMNAGNMPKVAKDIREKYPNAKISIYGDCDPNGIGQAKAKEAWDVIGGKASIFIPTFSKADTIAFKVITHTDKAPTDWNDYYLIKSWR